jgi:phosphoribosylformimino-5-aminoimidazole carboxamide ribonucleotide (ProFAR) isomerase
MREMCEATEFPVLASGGVTVADDVTRLARLGLAGCIVGRTLYEGRLTLGGALAAAEAP